MVERYHLIQVAYTTDLEIEVRKLIVLFMLALGKKGIKKGSLLHDEEGKPVPMA